MAHTIDSARLTPGTFVNVRGKVDFARLTRFLTPEEAAAELKRRQIRNPLYPNMPDKPFTTITITDPQIVPSQPNGVLTLEEQYVQESFYKSGKDGKYRYALENKSQNFPRFYQVKINENGSIDNRHVIEIPAQAEPAKGLDIVLVLRVYKPKAYPKCGIGLDAIIAQEEMRFYQANSAVTSLAQMGYSIDKELSAEERDEAHKQAAKAPISVETPTEPMGNANPNPNPSPIPTPVGDAYSTGTPVAPAANPNMGYANPMPQNPVNPNMGMGYNAPATPVTPAQPVAPTPAMTPNVAPATDTTPWVCGACGTSNTGKFCNNCGTQKPEAVAGNQYVTPDNLGAARTGIVYDPENNNRNY